MSEPNRDDPGFSASDGLAGSEIEEAEARQAWRRWLLRGAAALLCLGFLLGALALYQPEGPEPGDHSAGLMRAALALAGTGLALALIPLFIRRRPQPTDRTP